MKHEENLFAALHRNFRQEKIVLTIMTAAITAIVTALVTVVIMNGVA